VVGIREAAAWSAVWVTLGVAFGAVVWWVWGAEFAGQYFAGYVIEKSLAVDNVFVFAIIFSYFAVPRQYQHRVLFYGVLGALIFRSIFIAAGSVLIASFAWILYIFGAFLV
ncbi:tellurium resistance protein TerC, partial [Mycobacterium sp. ITM-2017-0098]